MASIKGCILENMRLRAKMQTIHSLVDLKTAVTTV